MKYRLKIKLETAIAFGLILAIQFFILWIALIH